MKQPFQARLPAPDGEKYIIFSSVYPFPLQPTFHITEVLTPLALPSQLTSFLPTLSPSLTLSYIIP